MGVPSGKMKRYKKTYTVSGKNEMQYTCLREIQTFGGNWKQQKAIDFCLCLWNIDGRAAMAVKTETVIFPSYVSSVSSYVVSWHAWLTSLVAPCCRDETSFLTCESSETLSM